MARDGARWRAGQRVQAARGDRGSGSRSSKRLLWAAPRRLVRAAAASIAAAGADAAASRLSGGGLRVAWAVRTCLGLPSPVLITTSIANTSFLSIVFSGTCCSAVILLMIVLFASMTKRFI